MIGKKFNMLTIIGYGEDIVNNSGRKYKQVICKCDCGKETIKKIDLVRQGSTKSCGCLKGVSSRKHGMVGTPIHNAWMSMKNRCNNSGKNGKNKSYIGVTYSNDWNKFQNFYNDMAGTWFKGAELDKDILCNRLKIEPKRYGPDTCLWVTREQNQIERDNSGLIEYKGKMQTIKVWGDELGISAKLLYKRINDYGWDTEKAFTKKVRKNIKHFTYMGETLSLKELSKKYNIKYRTLSDRIYKGLTIEQAIEKNYRDEVSLKKIRNLNS